MTKEMYESNQIKTVSSFSELVTSNFSGSTNALCWERNLDGDFKEIVSKLVLKEDITEVSIDDLCRLELSERGNKARETIIEDLKYLTELGASPSLNLLKKYERDEEFNFISTDVYSFHVDYSPISTSTFLCTYFGTSGDILDNEQAIQKILIPEIRKELRELYDGDDKNFDAFLNEYYFDLHYQSQANARTTNLGVGNLWRISVKHPGQKVMPCIHRAPLENEGEYRLLLIC